MCYTFIDNVYSTELSVQRDGRYKFDKAQTPDSISVLCKV